MRIFSIKHAGQCRFARTGLGIVTGSEAGIFRRIAAAIRRTMEAIAPSADTLAQAEAGALRGACCGLLMEVARLESPGYDCKRAAVAQALQTILPLQREEAAALIAAAESTGNPYTSYYEPVVLINKGCSSQHKVQFVEQLWRVALADGEIDMYEDQLVRKLAELLYVAHVDLILARRRAQEWAHTKFAAQAKESSR